MTPRNAAARTVVLGMGFHTAFGELAVDLGGRFVEAQFDDRDIGVDGLEVLVDVEAGEVEFDLFELFKAIAEVNEEQIAFVSEHGEDATAFAG